MALQKKGHIVPINAPRMFHCCCCCSRAVNGHRLTALHQTGFSPGCSCDSAPKKHVNSPYDSLQLATCESAVFDACGKYISVESLRKGTKTRWVSRELSKSNLGLRGHPLPHLVEAGDFSLMRSSWCLLCATDFSFVQGFVRLSFGSVVHDQDNLLRPQGLSVSLGAPSGGS